MMYDKSKNHRGPSIAGLLLNQRTLAIFGLSILIIISIPLVRNFEQKKTISDEIKEMEREISRVENKNTDLKKLIDYFESDQFIEEQARLNLGLKKGGEQVAVIKNIPESQTIGDAPVNSNNQIFNIPGLQKQIIDKPEKNPAKWWKFFFINKNVQ